MDFIERTIEVAKENVKKGGRPFACLIVKDGKILVEAANQVAQSHDPTAHAEILAIQKGSQILKSEHFKDCEFYILARCALLQCIIVVLSVLFSLRHEKNILNIMSIIENISPSKTFMKKWESHGKSVRCLWSMLQTLELLKFINYGKR